MAETKEGSNSVISLKDQGNEFFKSGKYLKAAALYTQAIKKDPSNPTLYSNRAAALLQLDKLSKALDDAEMTIKLKPQWEKGYFRKGSILEAMKRYDEALAAFQTALQYNPQSQEVLKKIKRINQLVKDSKRAQEVENMRSNVDMAKHLDTLKSEMSGKYGSEDSWKEIFSFLVETMETAVKSWHETSSVDSRAYYLLDKEKTQTDKYAPVVNIDKAFETPQTHSSCFSFLRQYAEESFSKAACLVTAKSSIAYPQVWKGQGSRKWKHAQNDGFFVQFESPSLRKLWFIPSSNEKGQTLCRDPEVLDIGSHEVVPRIFKENLPISKPFIDPTICNPLKIPLTLLSPNPHLERLKSEFETDIELFQEEVHAKLETLKTRTFRSINSMSNRSYWIDFGYWLSGNAFKLNNDAKKIVNKNLSVHSDLAKEILKSAQEHVENIRRAEQEAKEQAERELRIAEEIALKQKEDEEIQRNKKIAEEMLRSAEKEKEAEFKTPEGKSTEIPSDPTSAMAMEITTLKEANKRLEEKLDQTVEIFRAEQAKDRERQDYMFKQILARMQQK